MQNKSQRTSSAFNCSSSSCIFLEQMQKIKFLRQIKGAKNDQVPLTPNNSSFPCFRWLPVSLSVTFKIQCCNTRNHSKVSHRRTQRAIFSDLRLKLPKDNYFQEISLISRVVCLDSHTSRLPWAIQL